MRPEPRLSVVLAGDRYETVAEAAARFRGQTIADAIELVLVGPPGIEPAAEDHQAFAHATAVTVASTTPLARARAEGIRAAWAPFVLVGETHALPEPGLAEALAVALEQDELAGVAPVLRNGNPDGSLSWANMFLTYGRWTEGRPRGAVDAIPAHNGCFRRSVLVTFGPRLEELLEPGSSLCAELRAAGQRFAVEPRAVLEHLNVSGRSAFVRERFVAGRWMATMRARRWSRARRAAYVAGFPLIPVAYLVTVIDRPFQPPLRRLPRLTVPALLAGALIWGAGEALGYLLGPGNSAERLTEYELHRRRYLSTA